MSSGKRSMSSGTAFTIPSASPISSCIPASSISGIFSIRVSTTVRTVSTTEGISSGKAPPIPVAKVTIISAAAPIRVGRLPRIPCPKIPTICIAAPRIMGKLSRIPCPKAPISCIPASIMDGRVSTTIPRPSLKMMPSAPIAPEIPPASKAFVSSPMLLEPNCTNSRIVGVSSSESAILNPSSALFQISMSP